MLIDYMDKENSPIEKYYQVTSIEQQPSNRIFRGFIRIDFDNQSFIEADYRPDHYFIYNNGKLYVNASHNSSIRGFVILLLRYNYKENLWNILETIDDNPEVINIITKFLSYLS